MTRRPEESRGERELTGTQEIRRSLAAQWGRSVERRGVKPSRYASGNGSGVRRVSVIPGGAEPKDLALEIAEVVVFL
jgi:hypothetical protein